MSPRLISVAEIIKRNFLQRLRERKRDASSWSGLYQYNAMENVEDTEAEPEPNDVVAALTGKNL